MLARNLMRRGAAVIAATGVVVIALVALGAPAQANPAGPHDAIGAATATKAVGGVLTVTGWAADPDNLTHNATVAAFLDGKLTKASVTTSLANAAVRKTYHTGPTPGFTLAVPIPAKGTHTICVDARNYGPGMDTILECVPTPVGTKLSSTQLAAHSPIGVISSASATKSAVIVKGWATDPDVVSRRSVVVLYVDGSPAATVDTTAYPAPRPAGAGPQSTFSATVAVTSGAHLACIWVVNVGLGSNAFLGCDAVDTRGAAGKAKVTTPALNTKVVTEAKKHIGQAYVWGATGPRTFDCSGLVDYSYGKFGHATPRVSEAQFSVARLIPKARAVPGDLVFYHDSEGDVYHVGIYTGPGMSVAAIDTAEGVNYQKIFDPTATYGSFTHT